MTLSSPVPERPALDPEHVHNLIMLYLAVAYGADHNFDDREERVVQRLVGSWVPEAGERVIESTVRAALDLYRAGTAMSVEGLARGLAGALPPALRLQVLGDLGSVARADGERSQAEAAVIARVRAIWER